MSNISQISKAPRLTEKEVHAAAEELQLNGGKVGSIDVYRYLGRGSLTTITNFLKTWNQEEKTPALPALIMLPEALKKTAELLIVKVWAESQALAEQELKSQQEALRQAEAMVNEKIAEAEAFSEEQARQIETLKTEIEEMEKDFGKSEEAYLKTFTESKVLEEKLKETEKSLNNANALLFEQQKLNQASTAENITLQAKLEAANENLSRERNQKSGLEDKIYQLECCLGEKVGIETRANKAADEMEKIRIENIQLSAKAAKLEGELIAWQAIKGKAQKTTLTAPEVTLTTTNVTAAEVKANQKKP